MAVLAGANPKVGDRSAGSSRSSRCSRSSVKTFCETNPASAGVADAYGRCAEGVTNMHVAECYWCRNRVRGGIGKYPAGDVDRLAGEGGAGQAIDRSI